jgi:hypothetical protein
MEKPMRGIIGNDWKKPTKDDIKSKKDLTKIAKTGIICLNKSNIDIALTYITENKGGFQYEVYRNHSQGRRTGANRLAHRIAPYT